MDDNLSQILQHALSRSLEKIGSHASRHRLKNPFTMSKKRADPAHRPKPDLVSSSLEFMTAGGAYRDRTDDPLLAKQVLSQLS